MKYLTLLLASAALLCISFSFQPNTESSDLPPINFYGTITGRNEQTWNAQYITIGGRYKKIPLYAPVTEKEQNPHANKIFIDLTQIKTIAVLHNQPTIKYKHRIFVPVAITLQGQAEAELFLIEQTRKIICHQITESNIELPQEITFQALAILSITGNSATLKTNSSNPQKQTLQEKQSDQKNAVPEIKKTVHFTSEETANKNQQKG